MTRTIRLFLSSPSDVLSVQRSVMALAAETNDVLAFLAPQLDVRLEVVRYQDDVYPDVGRPQEVVDRQIPQDYDIHLGIMWMRCGTATANEKSGTVHEFRQAMRRREATGRPCIMFYFSDEAPPSLPRTDEELDQLRAVLNFREELQQIGLTMSYPGRASFRERVRVGWLRAVADVAKSLEADGKIAAQDKESLEGLEVPKALLTLAADYDKVRRDQSSGWQRTRRMTAIYDSMVSEAPSAAKALGRLVASGSAGMRLAAIAVLFAFPDARYLDWLAERLDPELEKPFVGFQAAVSLLQAVRSLSNQAFDHLDRATADAMELAVRNPNDPPRIKLLEQARRELDGRKRRPLA